MSKHSCYQQTQMVDSSCVQPFFGIILAEFGKSWLYRELVKDWIILQCKFSFVLDQNYKHYKLSVDKLIWRLKEIS